MNRRHAAGSAGDACCSVNEVRGAVLTASSQFDETRVKRGRLVRGAVLSVAKTTPRTAQRGASPSAAASQAGIPYTPKHMGDTPNAGNSVARILIIEDDPDIREVIRMHLEKEPFAVVTAEDGMQGVALAAAQTFTLVILDLGLPGLDGLEICRQLSTLTPRPLILILTARSAEIDRVHGLDRGADDYMVKPFGMLELVARVRALLRRPPLAVAQLVEQAERAVVAGALVIDNWERCAKLGARRIELTAKEFDLLLWFAQHPHRVFSRAELLDAVWGSGYEGYEHTVNSHLNRLRAKIERDPSHPSMLVTVRGGGYKLVPPEIMSANSPPPAPPAAGGR